MENTAIAPIQQNQRTVIVDILRGWALLGVALMNYIDYADFGLSTAPERKIDLAGNITYGILNIFFAAKSWTMLSLLFGYGFAVLINNIQKKGLNPVKFFTGRMFWLLVIAFINCCFFFGDILKDYAIMGLFFLLFYKTSGKFAFILAACLIMLLPICGPLVSHFMPFNYGKVADSVMPLYHSHNIFDVFKFNLLGTYRLEVLLPNYAITVHVAMLACMLLGFSAFKYDVFNNLVLHQKRVKKVFWWSLAVAISVLVVFIVASRLKLTFTRYYNPRYISVLSTMIFIMSAICCLYIKDKLKRFFSALQSIGKMTLTNYMVQNVISMFVFSGAGFGVYNTQHPLFYVGLALGVYIIQVFFSKWWLKNYYYGPVEWVWRQLSYGKRLPIKKGGDSGSDAS
ncbi:DUF418 domain-containing protein [Mucilaginibacter sp. AW1-3]